MRFRCVANPGSLCWMFGIPLAALCCVGSVCPTENTGQVYFWWQLRRAGLSITPVWNLCRNCVVIWIGLWKVFKTANVPELDAVCLCKRVMCQERVKLANHQVQVLRARCCHWAGTDGLKSPHLLSLDHHSFRYGAYFFYRLRSVSSLCVLKYSLCNEPLIELSNPGASGSIFYVSSDDEFIIKTVQHKEAEFLQKLLPGYFMVGPTNTSGKIKFSLVTCVNESSCLPEHKPEQADPAAQVLRTVLCSSWWQEYPHCSDEQSSSSDNPHAC